jgi:hypothetical protein
MTSWKKHFKPVNLGFNKSNTKEIGGKDSMGGVNANLPQIYTGHAARLQRYYQFDEMDNDPLINKALSIIADFCTQTENDKKIPFNFNMVTTPTDSENSVLNTELPRWIKANNLKNNLWGVFRDVCKYGDAFFLRDPENGELLRIDQYKVEGVQVDETKGKKIIAYYVKGYDYNDMAKYVTEKIDSTQTPAGYNQSQNAGAYRGQSASAGNNSSFSLSGNDILTQGGNSNNAIVALDAKHIVHLSLNAGMDPNWPFGKSILEPLYKTYKQKSLLEDAVLIYRIQRAPERRAFFIDVGEMNASKANAYIENLKNQIHQKKLPSRLGNGNAAMDAAYNPLMMLDDYWFALSSTGRSSRVETLPGGDGLQNLPDLDYFKEQMLMGLNVPPEYLGLRNTSIAYNDGKVGAAMIQELQFNRFCERLQNLIITPFDEDFKEWLNNHSYNIDIDLFELVFYPPQNFAKYREIDIQSARIANYTSLADDPKISQRLKCKMYLGWDEKLVQENERMLLEENPELLGIETTELSGGSGAGSDPGFSDIGIRTSEDDLDFDTETGDTTTDTAEPDVGDTPDETP